MPGADEKLIDTLEENIFMMDQLTTVLDEDGAEELFRQVLKGLEYHIVGEAPVEYRCTCSRERFAKALSGLEPEALDEMIRDGAGAFIRCDFCRREYLFTTEDLIALRNR